MTRTAVYAGSFDPITRGHEDLIRRSLAFVDRIVVAVATNIAKQPLFTLEERVTLDIEANRDAHVYVIHEDARHRKYLLHPTGESRGGSTLRGGTAIRLPRGGPWTFAPDDEPGWIVAVVAVEAIGPLEDSIPQGGGSGDKGRDGGQRIKPVAVRGLQRVLAQRGLGTPPGATDDRRATPHSAALPPSVRGARRGGRAA